MSIDLGLSDSDRNTNYAPLGVLGYKYRQLGMLEPLSQVKPSMKTVRYDSQTKLEQLVVSLLSGCRYLSEVNRKLKPETRLSQVWQFPGFADQSQLSRYLDGLSEQNIVELRRAVGAIWQSHSQLLRHDWRRRLTVDLDLSGLPCSKRSEGASKGYISGKKIKQVVNWLG